MTVFRRPAQPAVDIFPDFHIYDSTKVQLEQSLCHNKLKIKKRKPNNEAGSIEFISVGPEHLNGALEVMRKAFFPDESACVAIGLSQEPEAFEELEELTLRAIRDGISFIAVEKSSNKVVGGAFNKIQVNGNEADGTYFKTFADSCKNPRSRALVQFMIDVDASFDLFQHCGIDCLLEIMFLAVLPEYRCKRIAEKLCEVSIKAARKLYNCENVKKSIDGHELSLEPVPKAVAAIFTSPLSQRIGRKLDFDRATTIEYNKFSYNGKPFSNVLGEGSITTLEYIKF